MAVFAMTGGGTGGHVTPALAVARELAARGHSPHFLGTRRGMESTMVPAAGFPIDWIEIGGLKRVGAKRQLSTLGELPVSVWQAARFLDRMKPAAVFSTGGYVAGPALLAALWKRIPVVVMEPNAMPGFTHRKLARFVARALVSFPETARWFPAGRTEVTGMPVRKEFFEVAAKTPGRRLTLLVFGGSQGSRTLNRAVEESWALWGHDEVRLLHQTGRAAFDEISSRFKASGIDGEVAPFFDDMPMLFGQADVILCRSGMGTLSELAAASKPSILVPLPGASDQHQLHNAEAFAKAGAARLVLDAEMTGARLVEDVRGLVTQDLLKDMGTAAHSFAKPEAAQRAVQILEEFAGQEHRGRHRRVDKAVRKPEQ